MIAFEVNEDAHVETPEIDADFALVVTGAQTDPSALVVRYPEGRPSVTPPLAVVPLTVEIAPATSTPVVGTPAVYYRSAPAEPFRRRDLAWLGGHRYQALLPGVACGSALEYYVTATAADGTSVTDPLGAPTDVNTIEVVMEAIAFGDDFESGASWSIFDDEGHLSGGWTITTPIWSERGDPPSDFDGSGRCAVTGAEEDLDGAATRLVSPSIDIAELDDPYLIYARWIASDDAPHPSADVLVVEISADDGSTWQPVEIAEHAPGWLERAWRLDELVPSAASIRVRFSIADDPNDSVTEAAIDAVRVVSRSCLTPAPVADLDGDGQVTLDDLARVLAAWGPCADATCGADLDASGDVGLDDVLIVLSLWTG